MIETRSDGHGFPGFRERLLIISLSLLHIQQKATFCLCTGLVPIYVAQSKYFGLIVIVSLHGENNVLHLFSIVLCIFNVINVI